MIVDIKDVSKRYRKGDGEVAALVGVSLQLDEGDFVAVEGPSGSGKTTLLLTAGGLLHPDDGQVELGGEDLYALAPEARSRRRAASIGFVFQQFHLIPYLTVFENVMTPSLSGVVSNGRTRAGELLERFGLGSRADHRPSELSAGEKQRAALARAMLAKPKLLLADEPTGNLDETNGRAVMDAFVEYAAEGAAILLVTHQRDARDRAQRYLRLESGRLVATQTEQTE